MSITKVELHVCLHVCMAGGRYEINPQVWQQAGACTKLSMHGRLRSQMQDSYRARQHRLGLTLPKLCKLTTLWLSSLKMRAMLTWHSST